MLAPPPGELRIVWADEAWAHPRPPWRFLREDEVLTARRRGRPRHVGIVVAWSELHPKAPHESPGRFRRRVWWVRRDESAYCYGPAPSEGVDPATIRAGMPSLRAPVAGSPRIHGLHMGAANVWLAIQRGRGDEIGELARLYAIGGVDLARADHRDAIRLARLELDLFDLATDPDLNDGGTR